MKNKKGNKPLGRDAAFQLACVRKHTLTHCKIIPDFIRANGTGAVAEVAVMLGNFFLWVAPTLDGNAVPEFTPLEKPDAVKQLGQDLREVGLELWDRNTTNGQLSKLMAELKKQIATLERVERIRKGGAR